MTAPRVLLTGASGFVGRHCIGPLIDHGFEVHAVGNSTTDPRARWYRADLLDQDSRRRLIASVRPQALLHAAWVTAHGAFWHAPANLDWVAASLDLVRAATSLGTRKILVVGSCAEYDWAPTRTRAFDEDDPCRPATAYGIAKHALHQMLESVCGPNLTWARLFHLYGPHEKPERLVPALLRALHAEKRFETGPGDTLRDLLHVSDAGRALGLLLARNPGGTFNVASGKGVRIAALAGLAARMAGRPDLLVIGARAAAPGEPAALVADVTRLRALGFVPEISLEQGLAGLRGDKPGKVQAAAGDFDAAVRFYRARQMEAARQEVLAVLAGAPDHAPALNLLGVLHRQRGELHQARAILERAAARDPGNEAPWVNLGNVQLDLEDAEAAVQSYRRALDAAPQSADTTRLLGNALSRAGHDSEAMACLDKAQAMASDQAPVHAARARAHFAAGRSEPALEELAQALRLRPQDIDLRLLRAQMRRLSGDRDEALAELKALEAECPEDADVHLALGDALLAEEAREQANAHYRRAAELRPEDDIALGKLSWSLLNSRYADEAALVSEAATIARSLVLRGRLNPANAHAVQSALLRVADLDTMKRFEALFPDRSVLLDYWVKRNVIGALHAQLGRVRGEADRLMLVQWHKTWGDRYQAKVTPAQARPRQGQKIRVGFLSSDLRNHPVSYFALPIFEHYDRDRFELFAYSFHPGAPDAVQQSIAKRITAFRSLPNQPEQAIARSIAGDGLDILFELGGSTHLNRLEVMAYQPAPVQVSWLGYPHSSGLSRIGHILVDPYLRPPDPRLLIEQPFEMPQSWVSLGKLGFTDVPITPGLPERRQTGLTFGTMNNPYKYTEMTIALWASVLRQVPGSRFLFVRPESGAALFRQNIARAFARHGVSEDRIVHRAVRGQHLPHYNDIDIALDTTPQTGGTTTCECLWMGVPVISLVGPAFFERLSLSNLANAGLRDLAVDTPAGYVDAALALASDPSRRSALRESLRSDIRRSPLGDTRRWVRDFEAGIDRLLNRRIASSDTKSGDC